MATGLERRLDYTDFAALPADGKRYEILDGRLHVTPSPTPAHQWVCGELQRQLGSYFHPQGRALVFPAPLDVILGQHDIAQPDVVVVARSLLSQRGVEGAPLLVVEVLSPSTSRRDRGTKAERYSALGIQHYWLVDPERHAVECRRLQDGAYVLEARGEGTAALAVPGFPGLTIELAALWL